MKKLLAEISACEICKDLLPHRPRPVVRLSSRSRIVIIGQAPGRKVHETGIPWNDKSGEQLRRWLGVDEHTFYDTSLFSILPMGFCYPGKGVSGDLPPRPECMKHWHPVVFPELKKAELTILVGWHAQRYYLGSSIKENLTETVRSFADYLPRYFPLVHPSPRNGSWQKRNPWFVSDVLPSLRERIQLILKVKNAQANK